MPSDEEDQGQAEKEEDKAEMNEKEGGAEGKPEEINVGMENEAEKYFLENSGQEDDPGNKNQMSPYHERDGRGCTSLFLEVTGVEPDAQNDQKQEEGSQENISRRLRKIPER